VESTASRKDVWLGIIAAFSLVIALAKAAEGTFDSIFWAAVAALPLSILFATDKRTPTCGALLFLSVRFMFAFAVSHSAVALAGAVLAAGACIAFCLATRHE
jgi:hypothetical protein